MATTNFYRFDIVFADAVPQALAPANREGHVGRFYQIEQAAQGWKMWENGQPISLAPEQHDELALLLDSVRPLPDQNAEPRPPGCDGAWYTVSVRTGLEQRGYRWWVSPPPEWSVLGEVAKRVRFLADIPRQALADRNRELAKQYFDRLASGDVAGAMELCDTEITYSNPFFEGQHEKRGANEVALMWRAWLQMLPGAHIRCDDIRAGHEHAFVYWSMELTTPGGQRVLHKISAELGFAEGKITRHRDRLNLHEWAARTYGAAGGVLGGKAAFQKWIAARERARLAAFEVEMD